MTCRLLLKSEQQQTRVLYIGHLYDAKEQMKTKGIQLKRSNSPALQHDNDTTHSGDFVVYSFVCWGILNTSRYM